MVETESFVIMQNIYFSRKLQDNTITTRLDYKIFGFSDLKPKFPVFPDYGHLVKALDIHIC